LHLTFHVVWVKRSSCTLPHAGHSHVNLPQNQIPPLTGSFCTRPPGSC